MKSITTGRKTKCTLISIVLLVLSLVVAPLVTASMGEQESTVVPLEEARLAAQGRVEAEARKGTIPVWTSAIAANPVTYFNPDGSVAVYVFSVLGGQGDVGFVTVSAYKYPAILEYSTAPAPHIAAMSTDSVAAYQPGTELLPEPLIFLGPLMYASRITGSDKVEFTFVTLDGTQILNLSTEELNEIILAWRSYVEDSTKRAGVGVSVRPQASRTLSVGAVRQTCDTVQPCNCSICGGMCADSACGTSDKCWVGCHPAAGSSIMKYWNDHGCNGLGSDTDTIMISLHQYMNTDHCGKTTRPNSAAGIESYAASKGYDFDTLCISTHSGCNRQAPTFQQLVNEIDAGRPVILAFNGHANTGIGYDTDGQIAILNSNLGGDPRYVPWSEIASYTGNAAAGIITVHPYSSAPPTADAGGPYTANEGETVILNASGSSDPDGMIVSYEWDLDGDGEYDDATGQTSSWTWGDDYAGSIGLRVTDNDGAIGTDTTTVTISNVAPTVEAGPGQTVFRNDVVALSGSWTDPAGNLDELYSWTWDLDGDNTPDSNGIASYGTAIEETTSFTLEGSFTLSFQVMDKDGGTGSDSLVIEVLNRPPDCSSASPSVDTLWPPNHKFVGVDVLGVTDPEGDPVVITIDSIFQDECVGSAGDGSHTPDGRGVGTSTARVRAEREGSGNGRVYHISYTAHDGHGGTCSDKLLIGVPKSEGKKGSPVDEGPLFDSTKASSCRPSRRRGK